LLLKALLGYWFNLWSHARRRREAVSGHCYKGSAGFVRTETRQRQQGYYCLKYYVRGWSVSAFSQSPLEVS